VGSTYCAWLIKQSRALMATGEKQTAQSEESIAEARRILASVKVR
jgi:hypothetical protein